MNISMIKIAIGAIIFAVTGAVTATEASPRTITGLYFTTSAPNSCIVIFLCAPAAILITSTGTGFQATIRTVGGVMVRNLYTTANCGPAHKAHFRG